MRSALVIGGAGFIGSNLVRRLVRDGVRVVSVDNYSTGTPKNHVPGARYIEGDACHLGRVEIGLIPDVVFHLGEYSRVELSVGEPFRAIRGVCPTIVPVLELCHLTGAKLVYSGSSTRFGDAESPYMLSKALNVRTVIELGGYLGIPHAITYFCNVYGPHELAEGPFATVVPKFLQARQEGRTAVVNRPGTQRRNFTHVEDVAEGLVMVAERGQGDGYVMGGGDVYSIIGLAERIGVPWVFGDYVLGNRSEPSETSQKTLDLGWRPRRSLDEYIEQKIAHHACEA